LIRCVTESLPMCFEFHTIGIVSVAHRGVDDNLGIQDHMQNWASELPTTLVKRNTGPLQRNDRSIMLGR